MKIFLKKIIYKTLVSLANFIGKLVDVLVNLRNPQFLVQFFIQFIFIKKLKVNKDEIEKPIGEYRTFLSFFVRRLKRDARKIEQDKNIIVSPVDAKIIAYGKIKENYLIQIKEKTYSLDSLLFNQNNDQKKKIWSQEKEIFWRRLAQGNFINLYLSPRDYHLIHHPYNAYVKKVVFIPGELYPVNEFSLMHFKEVFARNKRMIIHYQTGSFSFFAVWVGAFNVGQLDVFFDKSLMKQQRANKVFSQEYELKVKKGDYAGAFKLGSSVILIFPQQKKFRFLCSFIDNDKRIKMGQPLARF